MSACCFPGCVALAVEADPERRCAVHRNPGIKARPCPDCSGRGSHYAGHPCERCGGTGFANQKLGAPREVTP